MKSTLLEKTYGNAVASRETDWEEVRNLFPVSKEIIHLAVAQYLSSHVKPVADAIQRYRMKLDVDPITQTQENEARQMDRIRRIAAGYLGMKEPDNIALTSNTTMGLGTIYTGLNIARGEEIITSSQDHYAHHESIRMVTLRTGGYYRKVELFRNLAEVTKKEIVSNVVNSVTEKTRIIGLTWVSSASGLKIPVAEIAKELKALNALREDEHQVLFLVDGVHGLGVEDMDFPSLGCDFLVSGCHKWLYGPRGTGLIAGTTDAWQEVTPVIPSFTDVMDLVIKGKPRPQRMDGKQMSPGGFQAFEHKWALYEAFQFIMGIGRKNISDRVHSLARRCKEGLASMRHVILHTPMDDELSSGIISFEVKDMSTDDAVGQLRKKKLLVTASPYAESWIRITPGIMNNEEDIDRALGIIEGLRK